MSEGTQSITDAEVLDPDREIEVGGEKVKVRAFRALEGLRATPIARPIVNSLRELAEGDAEAIEADAVMDLLARHAEAFLELVALSIGKPVDWVRSLRDEESFALAMIFWEVNAGFFMRRLAVAVEMARASGSSTSSATSSQPDMDPTPRSSRSDSPGASSDVSGTPNSAAENAGGPT